MDADIVDEQAQREMVIKSVGVNALGSAPPKLTPVQLLSSLRNTEATFGADSHQYLQIKQMVDEAIRRLREQGNEDEVSKLLQQMSLD